MPTPFPGMDPYLEQDDSWQDFHQNFITHAQEHLGPQLGPNYIAKIEVRLLLHELSSEERRFTGLADVGIVDRQSKPAIGSASATSFAPFRLSMPAVEIERHSSLEIRDRRDRRVVTAFELLSPTNKSPGPDRDDYLAKRRSYLAARTNFIEVDLRRGGRRPAPPDLPACDYYVLLCRMLDWPLIDVWPVALRDRLPVVPVPLSAPDADVTLDLQAVLNRAYDAADFGKYIYGEKPEPPLREADAEWAKQIILQKT